MRKAAIIGRLFYLCRAFIFLSCCVFATQRQPALNAGTPVFLVVDDEVKIAAKVSSRYGQRHEAAALECFAQRDARNTAYAQPCLDGAFDRFGVLQFEHDIEIWQQAVHGAVKCLPRARPGFAQNPCCLQ